MYDSQHLRNLAELYSSSAFRDCSDVNACLKHNNIEDIPPKYRFIYDIVELMSRLRFKAEEYDFSKIAHSKRRALPLDITKIADELSIADKKESPNSIITIIAQKHLPMIKILVENLHKILRRVRQKQNISSIQQIDPYCLQWLSKQSGYTVAEKAGNKQELLAVVRQESYFTLENKVLKDFLKKCSSIGKSYLNDYEKSFPDSLRIKAVKALINFSQAKLKDPVIQSIPNIYAMPTPNYALQYNARYSKLWGLYKQLMQQIKIIGLVWKERHKLFNEYFYINLLSNFLLLKGVSLVFKSTFWISFLPKNANFIENPPRLIIYKTKDFIFKIEKQNIEQDFIEIKISKFDKNGALLKEKSYKPLFLEEENISTNAHICYSLNSEDKDCVISNFKSFEKIYGILAADFEESK